MASTIDFQAIFDAGPAPYLLLCADPPRYTIADVNRAYLRVTGTDRDAIVGQGVFDVFPENPAEETESSESDLRKSLDRVLRDGVPDVMGVQKYDIPLRDGSGRYEVRYWSPINTPIVNGTGELTHILHRVEDITDFILAREDLGAAITGRSGKVRARDSIEAEVRRSGAELKEANRQLKAMSEQLVEANARLEGLDRLKTEFFANVSHEFRTPLTLMLGPLEQLSARSLGEEERQLVESAQRNALRLQKLVNTLLDFSRLEAGRLKVNVQPTDLSALTAELASHFDSACAEARVRLVVDCPPLDDPVPVDPDMWENIVLNLISNAFKFTFDGEIQVSLRVAGDMAELTVQDSGVGIEADELPLIFERFHRVQGQRGRSHEGSGIGLSLVRDLVRLHGGDISVESEAGRGTRFVVTIPLRRPEDDKPGARAGQEAMTKQVSARARAYAQEADHWAPPMQHAMLGDTSDMKGTGTGRRILLADDNADMRAYVARILIGAGYEVHAVPDADAALAALRDRPLPDLVLSDVMMPGRLDGFGLLRTLRSAPETETLPFMLLSARAGPEARIEGLEAGADEYVVKPFGARELLARIDAALRLGKMRREAALRERELQTARAESKLRLAMETARMGEVIFNLKTGSVMHTPGLALLYGYPGERELTLDDMRLAYHPEDRTRVERARAQALADDTEYMEIEHRVIWPDGTVHWLAGRFHIERDRNGEATEATAVYMDITERKWVEERQSLLLDELNHRVKNTLSTVQSIALQTRRGADSPEQFSQLFEGRIAALAGAHDLLTEASWEGASLADVIGRTLAPYALSAQDGAARIIFGGPLVRLSPNAAVTLNMAFHELATNAAKYGALSTAEGRLEVCWTVDRTVDPPTVELFWSEHGGPPVEPPARRGFGTRLVEQGLARELDGEVELHYEPEGLQGKIRLPASHKVAPL
jgi:PAS domain S-box-containing protein